MRALLLTVFALCACAPEHQVLGRPYEVQTPKGSSADTPLPVLILAHGYGASGFQQDVVFPFSLEVDARQFRYVRPHGTLDAEGHRFWNASPTCCNFGDVPVDDVAFFRALVDDVKAQYPTTRVYLVGHSNGGGMALRLLCDAPELFDGIVGVSAAIAEDFQHCVAGQQKPLLLVHGTVDTTIPYDGKPGTNFGPREHGRRYARHEGCGTDWTELDRADFLDSTAELETKRERYAGCSPDLELWTMEGVGHIPSFDHRWTGAVLDWLTERAP